MFCHCLLINNKHIGQAGLFNSVTVIIAFPVKEGGLLSGDKWPWLSRSRDAQDSKESFCSLNFLRDQAAHVLGFFCML